MSADKICKYFGLKPGLTERKNGPDYDLEASAYDHKKRRYKFVNSFVR